MATDQNKQELMAARSVPRSDVTVLLERWRQGENGALDALTPLIYHELHRLAAGKLNRERPGHTLQPTALIHEAYLKLIDHNVRAEWQNRAHFFAVASQLMRQILVDHSRLRSASKRGGGVANVPLDDLLAAGGAPEAHLLALDDALRDLAAFDERKSRLIELKFFGGLSNQEIAEALGISIPTVVREARLAEAWLYRHIQGESKGNESGT